MLLKAVLLVLACVLPFGLTRKTIKTTNQLSSPGDGEGTDRGLEYSTSGVVNDLLSQVQSQLQNHDRMLREAYSLIHQQERKLSQQEDILRQQAETLHKQGELLERLLSEQPQAVRENAESSELPDPGFRGKSVSKNTIKEAEAAVKTIHAEAKNVPSPLPRLQSRSDDSGPLQILIEHTAQKITEMDAEIGALKNLYQHVKDVQASSFVRWGNSRCSDNSELVYAGVIGGSWYNHQGAANPLCLTMHPVPSNLTVPSGKAYLYGAEYQTFDAHYHKDPVCAVCRSRYSTTLMVPGTDVCEAGWHLDYSGFLMAGLYNQPGGSEFICVDLAMAGREGSDQTQYGTRLYYTVTQCGSLPCEPYVQNTVVTCAVCSK